MRQNCLSALAVDHQNRIQFNDDKYKYIEFVSFIMILNITVRICYAITHF